MYPYKKQTRNTRTLPIGWQFAEGRRPLHQETVFDEVVEIPLRDGVKVRQTQETCRKHYLSGILRSTVTFSGPSQMPKFLPSWPSAHMERTDTVCNSRKPASLELNLTMIWSQGFRIFDNIPFRLGLPESATSGLEKFEG